MPTKTIASDRHTAVTTGWTNPGNAWATTGDNVYATAAPAKNATIDGDFGFPAAGISADSVIDAVRIVVEWGMTASVTGGTLGVQGRNNAVADTGAETTQTSITEAQATKTFATLPSAADLNTAGRVVGRVRCSKGNTNTAMTGNLDFVRLEIDYHIVGQISVAGAGTLSMTAYATLAGSWAQSGAGTIGFDGTVTAGGGGGATVVQQTVISSATSPATSPSITVTAGNVLFAVPGNASGSTNAHTVTDSNGNTWTRDTFGYQTGVASTRVELWRAVIAVGKDGALTVTATTAGTAIQMIVFEVSGLDTASLLDQASTAPSGLGAVNPIDTPTLTVTGNHFAIAAMAVSNSSGSRTSTHTNTGGNWTELTAPTNQGSTNVRAAYWTTANGSVTDEWSMSPSTQTGSGILTATYNIAAGGGTTQQGSLSVTGTATVTRTGTVTYAGGLSPNGAGTISEGGVATYAGSLSVAGSGAVTYSGAATYAAALSVSGSGILGQTGGILLAGALSLTGTGAISQAGTRTQQGSLAVAGAGTITENPTAAYSGGWAQAGAGTISETPAVTYAGGWSQTGTGQLGQTPTRTQFATWAQTGAGFVTPTATATYAASLPVTGVGSLSMTPAGGGPVAGSIALTGTGLIAWSPTVTYSGSWSQAAAGTLAWLSSSVAKPGSLSVAGAGTMGQTGFATMAGAWAQTGAGTLTQTGAAKMAGSLVTSGSGTFAVSGYLTLPGSAAFVGTGAVSASGGVNRPGALSVTGTGVVSLPGSLGAAGAWSASGVGTFAPDGTAVRSGTFGPTGVGQIVWSTTTLVLGTWNLTGGGGFTGRGILLPLLLQMLEPEDGIDNDGYDHLLQWVGADAGTPTRLLED